MESGGHGDVLQPRDRLRCWRWEEEVHRVMFRGLFQALFRAEACASLKSARFTGVGRPVDEGHGK